MAFAAGGELAAAVANAGGMGLIGGAYGDAQWLDEQFSLAGDTQVGCGFITWSLAKNLALLDHVLEKKPGALFLSFGDPAPFVQVIKSAGVALICQVQTLRDAQHAIGVGADVIVAQGSEAGGHGEKRGTLTLVPEVADFISRENADVMLCAAGGIADGRGLAASLMLGADGVVMGSRFWATHEAQVHPNMLQAAIDANGDDTIRSSVMDIARRLNWPDRYTARVLKNAFTDQWHDDLPALLKNQDDEADRWRKAWVAGDITTANTFVGEVAGLIDSIESAADVLRDTCTEAKALLSEHSKGLN